MLFYRFRTFAICGALVGCTFVCGCRQGEPTSDPGASSLTTESIKNRKSLTEAESIASHQRMIKTLADIADAFEKNTLDFNPSTLDQLRTEIQAAHQNRNLIAVVQLQTRLAEAFLRLGKTNQSISNLQSVLEMVKRAEKAMANADAKMKQSFIDSKAELNYSLGVAALRKAEDDNCVNCRLGESCILPIVENGVHQNRAGSEAAVVYLKRSLDLNPDNPGAVWLLNLAAMTLGGYPDLVPEPFRVPESRFEGSTSVRRFDNIASSVGLGTVSLAGGAIADDFDNDGFVDVMVSDWHPKGQLRLFRNTGNGDFQERTKSAGLTGITGGLNLVQTDFDNDGDIDVLVLRGGWLSRESDGGQHPCSLLRNDVTKFVDVTFAVGLGDQNRPTQSGSWADYDNDGDLDLFLANENAASQLFQNNGHGFFVDVAPTAGVTNDGYAKGCTWGDFDGDRYPDLYVSNLNAENRLYRNNGNGTFTDVADQLGVERPLKSFPVWFWDYNNDGNLDLYVSSYTTGVKDIGNEFTGKADPTPDCLYRGDGKGFQNVSAEMGVVQETQPMGCNFGDLDNDGFLDFYLATGYPEFAGLMPNLMFRNQGGKSFADVTYAGGFGHLQKGHGVAFADFDHDGDQDVFTEMGGWYEADVFQNALFNNPGNSNHWIKVKLVGQQTNRAAIGARICLKLSESNDHKERTIYRWVTHGSSFGANPLRQEIGLGSNDRIKLIEIYWPTSDTTQTFQDVTANQCLEITEGSDILKQVDLPKIDFQLSATAAAK